jgi:hypothetical protein
MLGDALPLVDFGDTIAGITVVSVETVGCACLWWSPVLPYEVEQWSLVRLPESLPF